MYYYFESVFFKVEFIASLMIYLVLLLAGAYLQYCSRPPVATHYAYFRSTRFFYIPKFLPDYPAFRQRKITFYILILLFSLNEIVLRASCTTESNEQLAIISIIIHIWAFFTSFSLLLWMIEIFMQSQQPLFGFFLLLYNISCTA